MFYYAENNSEYLVTNVYNLTYGKEWICENTY